MSDDKETAIENEEMLGAMPSSEEELTTAEIEHDDGDDGTVGVWNDIEPKGAFAFVILMFALYLVYWFMTYFEIFISRGA